LAAVDSHVARHVFGALFVTLFRTLPDTECFSLDNVIGPQGLLATKARILVTNSIAYLRDFDQIAYMRRGIILECGPYCQLVATPGGAIRNMV
jgi:ATP-binding cassette subfamily C (CFTR/MRP) protein 1